MAQNFAGQVRQVVQVLLPQFDQNRNGALEVNELGNFLNASFRALGYNLNLSQQDALSAFQRIDKDGNRVATLDELERTLVQILAPNGQVTPRDFNPQPLQGGQQGGQFQGQGQQGQFQGQGQPGQFQGQGQQGQFQGQQGGQQGGW